MTCRNSIVEVRNDPAMFIIPNLSTEMGVNSCRVKKKKKKKKEKNYSTLNSPSFNGLAWMALRTAGIYKVLLSVETSITKKSEMCR